MKADHAWRVAIAVALCLPAALGCTATGKPLAGASLPGIKREDKALRAAVEKDPFPRAQGMTAAGKS
jgi:hypothetical protein